MNTSTLDDPVLATFGRLLEAAHRLERRLGADLEDRAGMGLTWFEVLLRLSRSPRGRLTMGELSGQLVLTSGGVTRLIDRMVAEGDVERSRSDDDRRVQYARLTPSGRTALRAAARVHAEGLHDAFAGLSAADRRALDRLTDRLRSDSE